jgi:hypothetical protein
VRFLRLLLLAAVLAGCGSKSSSAPPTATTGPADPAAAIGGQTIYQGGDWAVVTNGDTAVALHLAGDVWRPDRSGRVKIALLGPHGVQPPTTQVAAELSAPTKLVESALWVDGVELLEKGGGVKPSAVTVYGAPDGKLKPGKHVAIAYGRTQDHGTAVAWTFTVA